MDPDLYAPCFADCVFIIMTVKDHETATATDPVVLCGLIHRQLCLATLKQLEDCRGIRLGV
jgi:hypothetical protein